jgi:hypothetical protein
VSSFLPEAAFEKPHYWFVMTLRPETESYLDGVEQFVGKQFRYRSEIGLLIELAEARTMKQVFDDITFFAKFVSNAYIILKRVGPASKDIEKMSLEFKDKLEKVSTLLRTLIKEEQTDAKQQFVTRFLSLSNDSMNNLLELLYELSWIKNYSLDQKRSP